MGSDTQGSAFDDVLKQIAAAPAMYPTLPAATVVAERYVVERVLGMGGMAVVYLANDRILKRAVALKLLKTDFASARLHQEAVAMAQLAHPNVVAVYEVGTFEQRPFVAMEYVDGTTLRGWLEAEHSEGEILDALHDAGKGLAAAHAAKLIHRDIKPENILRGKDGRVRVSDFGLAHVGPGAGPERTAKIDEDSTTSQIVNTATGAIMGTPAYMAPEQIDGVLVTAQTDQFAFCVMAWECLTHKRPFAGGNTAELRAAIGRGATQTSTGKMSRSVRNVLLRGMAVNQQDRWPSMLELLAHLQRARLRPRIVAAAAIAVASSAAIATWAMWPAPDPLAVCATEVAAFDTALPQTVVDDLLAKSAFAPSPMEQQRGAIITAALANQRQRAQVVTQTACRARVERQWSPQLVAASRECLLDHASSVREVLVSTAGAGQQSANLVAVVSQLPQVESCGSPTLLAGWKSLATEPSQLQAVISARAQIANAIAQLTLGQIGPAKQILALVQAHPLRSQRAVSGRAELLAGMVHMTTGNYAQSNNALMLAYQQAREMDDGALLLAAVGELIDLTANVKHDAVAAQRWITDGLADAKRERNRHPAAAGAVVLKTAFAALLVGDAATTLERLALAEEILQAYQLESAKGTSHTIRAGALVTLGKTDEALVEMANYIANVRRLFGPGHPILADALSDQAAIMLEVDDRAEAAKVATEAKAIIDSQPATVQATKTLVLMNLGATLVSLEDPSARLYLELARSRLIADFGPEHLDIALIDVNLAVLENDDGHPQAAIAKLTNAIRIQQAAYGADHMELAPTLYNLAVAERDQKQYAQALEHAQRCMQIFQRWQAGSMRHMYALALIAMIANLDNQHELALTSATTVLATATPDQLEATAWAQLEAARAMLKLRRKPAEAQQLLTTARKNFEKLSLPHRIKEIDQLLNPTR